ncbi:MAG: hypothetical protein QM796_13950 [Chthoniobacteraceae bacterium]
MHPPGDDGHGGGMQHNPDIKSFLNGLPADQRGQAMDFLRSVPPDNWGRAMENFKIWLTLTKEQQNLIRGISKNRQDRIKQEIDHAIKQSGLSLDPDQQKAFGKRYFDERRKIEMSIRRQMDDQRNAMTTDLIKRLHDEFVNKQASPSPSPVAASSTTPAPSASASPAASAVAEKK